MNSFTTTRTGRAFAWMKRSFSWAPRIPIFAWALSCNDGAHAFMGRTWDEANQCLGSERGLDVVNGAEGSDNCVIRCLRSREAPFPLHVTTMCDPNPADLEFVDGSDPECAKAVVAWHARAYCGADAGK